MLLCKRKNIDSWQFPQGGIDFGESPLKASRRELYEEVGIRNGDIKLISSTNEWFKYDVPHKKRKNNFLKKSFKGQKQKWFMFKLISDTPIHFNNDPDNDLLILNGFHIGILYMLLLNLKKRYIGQLLMHLEMTFVMK